MRLLANAGARAAIFDIQLEKGERLAAELGRDVIFACCDVTSEESTQAAIQKTVDVFGGLNVAINCAGGGWAEKVASKRGPAFTRHFRQDHPDQSCRVPSMSFGWRSRRC